MKLKRLFSIKNNNSANEISGSFGGDASGEILLDEDNIKKEDDEDEWNLSGKGKTGNADRGRMSTRPSMRRSSSERPSIRKRSKSEVIKRLKKLEGDFGMKTKKKGGSKSVGGVFRGKSRDVQSRIDSLALERSESDSKINQSGFDSIFDKSMTLSEPIASKPKKLRGGRRKQSSGDGNISVVSGGNSSRRRSKSNSSRGRRSTSVSSRKKRSSSTKRRGSSKPRRTASTSDASVSTFTTKDSKKKKKKVEKGKKKKIKDESESSDLNSIPSKVEMFNDCESQGSFTVYDSPLQVKRKKSKDKEKTKKTKRKSKSEFPELPVDDFGDGLEGLAEQFRKSKNKYGEEKINESLSKDSSDGGSNTKSTNANYTKVRDMFENAWTETEEGSTEIEPFNSFSHAFVEENTDGPYGKESAEDDMSRKAAQYEMKMKEPETTEQQGEILKLQQQLSAALQKQLTMSEEHVKEKKEFMNVTRELERVRVEFVESKEERNEVMSELKRCNLIIEENTNMIDNLEQAIDKQLGKEEELMKNVHHSEEEIEQLLEEIQKFETKLENGEEGGGGASFIELRNTKIALSERKEDIASQKLQIEQLEKELKDSMTVPQLQIEELDQENKALQGRLKGERLEYTSKLSAKDDIISNMRSELTNYTASPDAQDLQSARQKLTEAREDATTVREDLAATKKVIGGLKGEREDVLEEFNLLKDNNVFMEKTVKDLTEKADNLVKKVYEWTEKTYDWKKRAEAAERKIKEANEDNETAGIEMGDSEVADPQTMFLQAAMNKPKKAGGWGIFKNAPDTQNLTAEELRLSVLEEQNLEYEAKIAQLSSDIVKIQAVHKDQSYTTKKKIAQLEAENVALASQNSTLGQLLEG